MTLQSNASTALMFHNISNTVGRYSINPVLFDKIAKINKRQVLITIDDGYTTIYKPLAEITGPPLKNLIVFEVSEKVGLQNDWDQTGELAGLPLMDWPQIRELHKKGIQFGSHSATHPDLRRCTPQELDREVRGSKQTLEDRLGTPVDSFCYPYGQFNEKVIAAVQEAGYKKAYTTSDSILEGRGNPFRMRRVEIKGTDPDWLVRLKLSGLYDLKAIGELPVLVLEKYGWKIIHG